MQVSVLRRLSIPIIALTLAACRSDRTEPSEHDASLTPVCRECYEAVFDARRTHPAHLAGANQQIRMYTCPCCEAEMSVYTENGTHMVRCGGCATQGVAWDSCRPVEMTGH